MSDQQPSTQSHGAKPVIIAVLVTTLFWTIAWGILTVVRGQPQTVAFAVQPPPATATTRPTATPPPPTPTPSPTVTSQAAPASAPATVEPRDRDQPRTPEPDGETLDPGAAISTTARTTGVIVARIDINTASALELEQLPGIGPKTAEAIVAYRVENGPFASIDAIVEVKGIGPATLANIQELITVAGE